MRFDAGRARHRIATLLLAFCWLPAMSACAPLPCASTGAVAGTSGLDWHGGDQMSAAVDQAVLSALRGNSTLTALLATQDSGQPAIFNAHKLLTPPIYDQITFRESVKDPASFYAPTWNEDCEYYDFEVWTNRPGSGIVDNIRREIDRAVNKLALNLPDPQYNRMRYMRRMSGGSPTNYDHELKAWFGMFRYRVWVVSV